ncbi:hypothetical protein Tco_1281193 [Tanacetum coccineum]
MFKMTMASKSYEKHPAHKALSDALIQSIFVDEDDIDRLVMDHASQKKRRHKDKDEDPSAGSNQGKRKRSKGKDSEPLKKSLESKKTSKGDTPPKTSKSGKSVHAKEIVEEDTHEVGIDVEELDPLTFDELMATLIDFSKFAMNRLKLDKITKADLDGPIYNLLKGTFQSSIELEYNMEECYKALSNQLDWENPKGDLERKYIASITKTKAARYDLVGIEDMIPNQWSKVKVGYNKDAECGIKHGGPQASTILSVVSVMVNKLHGYGYLKEIVLFHLNDDAIIDLPVSLCVFTRRIIIKKRVEDVQLGVEISYQKKLNTTKPQKDFPTISAKQPYTPSFDPPGFVYEDLSNQKRLMRADKLYKFSDGTLKKVRDTLHHRLLNFRLGYIKDMPKRKWSATDNRRSCIMVKLIDELMLERRIMTNLERLVRGRPLEIDYRLMQHTV